MKAFIVFYLAFGMFIESAALSAYTRDCPTQAMPPIATVIGETLMWPMMVAVAVFAGKEWSDNHPMCTAAWQ